MEEMDFGQNKDQTALDTVTISDVSSKVKRLAEIAKEKADLAAKTKSLNGEKAAVEKQIIAALEANELRTFDGETHKVFFKNQTSVKIIDSASFKEAIGQEKWESLAKVDSRTAQTFFKEEKEIAEEEGNYDYQLAGVEYKEFTQLGMRKK